MSDIQAGDGWRLLNDDELTRKGDEQLDCEFNTWSDLRLVYGLPASTYTAVRRRIPAKPEAMEIEAENGTLELDVGGRVVWITQVWNNSLEKIRLTETTQIRQLIAWLQQVADWREAQELNK
jgi:hypothetical protein